MQLYKDSIAREQMNSYKSKASLEILQKLIKEMQSIKETMDQKAYFNAIVNEYLTEKLSQK